MTTAKTRARAPSLAEMRVEDAMHRGVLTVPLTAPLEAVARMMATYHVHCIVGLDEGSDDYERRRVWGLVSDLDLVSAAVSDDIEGRTAGGSAATEVLTVSPNETVQRAGQLMMEHGVAHVVVVDPFTNRPIGVLSTLDIAAIVSGRVRRRLRPKGASLEDLMTRDVVTVAPATSLKEVARILIENGISALPVVDGDEVVGVVSETDIVAKERGPARADGNILERFLGHSDPAAERLTARIAGDAMTCPAITIESSRPPSSAAALMIEHGINSLPVLKHGELVGIVSRADLVRAFARPDEEIKREIVDDVVLRAFWMSPDDIQVTVERGEVTLRGQVSSKAAFELLPEAAQRIPGVVGVRSELGLREVREDEPHWLRLWPDRN